MGWKTGHARLTPEEAKAQLLALTEERSTASVISRHPYGALAIAMAAGFFLFKTARFWSKAGSGGMWLLQQIVPLPIKPKDTALSRLRARARRVG